MHWSNINWTRILTILLVILASMAVLYVVGSVLMRFKQAIVLFTLGTMLAYILNPLVNRLEHAFRHRWLAIFISYAFVAAGLFALGYLLFTPFIQQAQSLVDNLHNPSTSSLKRIAQVRDESSDILSQLKQQRQSSRTSGSLPSASVKSLQGSINAVIRDTLALRNNTVSGPSHTPRAKKPLPPGRVPANPQPQTRVPPSYVNHILLLERRVQQAYAAGTKDPAAVDRAKIKNAVTYANQAVNRSASMYHTMATTPILLLRSQTWLDQHGINVDLASEFGAAGQQLGDQGTTILNNAITILSEAANTLINTILIMIIAFYLLNDGRRLIRRAEVLMPFAHRDKVAFFITSADQVVGGYIRGQLLLSALAGILGGGGAAILGVPYPLLIGIITFLLESIPVIGAIVAVVPALIISLFFNDLATTILLFVWFTLFQQLVTNILGPRVMGMAVGIHPLEALFAVLVGYPLGGFIGAFLAVPVMGILHILIREAYRYFVLGETSGKPAIPVKAAMPEDIPSVQSRRASR